jgi:adenine-specific DNA-methyltransferase
MTEKLEKLTAEDGKSLDLKAQSIENLKQLFPDVFIEGKVDFDSLKVALGEHLDDREERYGFTWHGKTKSRQLTQIPSTGTLRPLKEQSKNWASSQNLFIEGDNLEVLKLLQKPYRKKVSMIYIDPPYNTGQDFVYKDNFHGGLKRYLELTSQIDSDGVKVSANTETSGRYHTDWLNMIYPRLKLARNLLANNGVICIHIDEHEVHHLKMILNEIFGEGNFIGEIAWDKGNPKGDSTKIAYQHESVVVFANNIESFKESRQLKKPKANAKKMLNKARQLFGKLGKKEIPADLKSLNKKYKLELDLKTFESECTLASVNKEFQQWIKEQKELSGGEAAYKYIDNKGEVYRPVSMAWPNKKQAPDNYFVPLIHPATGKECPVPDRGWRNPPDTMKRLLDNNLIIFGEDESKQPERKYLLKENMFENVPSILKFSGSDDALLKKLGISFDNPKPTEFAQKLISYFTKPNELVLDFFAGSGTTGHACLNFEKNESRRFILVQLPEPISGKDGTISNITQKRLSAVCEENDLGFRKFILAESNIKSWSASSSTLDDLLEQSVETIVEGRTNEDVLFELLLKFNLELSSPINEHLIGKARVYEVACGSLIVCFENQITDDVVAGIGQLKEKLDSKTSRVVFKDSGFKDSCQKLNTLELLRRFNITDVKSL